MKINKIEMTDKILKKREKKIKSLMKNNNIQNYLQRKKYKERKDGLE